MMSLLGIGWTSTCQQKYRQEDLLDLQPGRDGRVCHPRHTFSHDGDNVAGHTSPVSCVLADSITETNRVLNHEVAPSSR